MIGEVHIKGVGYDYVYAYGSIVIFYDIMVDRSARTMFWQGLINGQSVFFFISAYVSGCITLLALGLFRQE